MKSLCLLLIVVAAVFATHISAQEHNFNQWENEIAAFETADKTQLPPKNAILFIGSSSIRMWTTLAADFPDKQVINRGFGGSQIADSTHFADRIIFPYEPRIIVFYAGDNDLQALKTAEQVFADYKLFVEKVRTKLPRTKIAFISIKPSPSRAALMKEIVKANKLIKKYSTKKRNLAFIDIYKPMLDDDKMPKAALFCPDMLHMNADGYAIWKNVIGRYLD